MARERLKRCIGLLLALSLIAGSLTEEALSLWLTPSRLRTTVGEEIPINSMFPQKMMRHVSVALQRSPEWTLHEFPGAIPVSPANATEQPGRLDISLRLLGWIPLKHIVVDVLPPMQLLAGGHSIGVLLHSQGVIIVGQAPITDEQGAKHYPGKDAGLQVGDVIHKVNGQPIKSDAELARAIDEAGRAGKKLEIETSRNGQTNQVTVEPIRCAETKRFRVGLYVRDRASGVGTLTFFEPKSKSYGALGHVINDADTNQRIDVAEGRIIPALVKSIQQGKRGAPGEKVGVFREEDPPFTGTIQHNTTVGIFGRLEGKLNNPHYPDPLPIALSAQVQEGPAEIITVVEGERLERFQIIIDRVMPHRTDGKGMIIRVTDPRLLTITGGIIQGMSGSPIIQNGKIVGAVTHVFINSPSTGYGVLIEKMLEEAGLWKPGNQQVGALPKRQGILFSKKGRWLSPRSASNFCVLDFFQRLSFRFKRKSDAFPHFLKNNRPDNLSSW
ncbi:stage iv sporulation protein b [Heliomicrobium modesticaldum Ice1]|uniref:Stage iv sporulation protein b n=1 Tax=Heliobacterium modesticaldum (strain ATCC 51547 / Ice1) TaxID=498761 RepID=B0TEK3_HELMI|nr:SpoIVB peptidase [Heliomicrobium modesticaldum]ABZ82922.1 stage iv sporulation protein b [Heliomicrobium modesticaldum Ice1]